MPMSYFYGRKFVGAITPLIQQLREEIYNEPYKNIKWSKMRHVCAKADNYYPHGSVQRLLWDGVYYVGESVINTWPFNKIRERAVQKAIEHIHYEDENSRYITIGCVEKVGETHIPHLQDIIFYYYSYCRISHAATDDACLLG